MGQGEPQEEATKEAEGQDGQPSQGNKETALKIELEQHEKTILYVVGGAGALLLIYWYLKSQGYWDQWFGSTVAPGPNPSPGPSAGVPTAQTLAPYEQAMQIMSGVASSPMMTVDQWAQLWQQGPPFQGSPMGFGVPGSITPSVMAGLTAGANNAPISAAQFVTLMLQQQQAGMSGYSKAAAGVSGYVQ